VTPLVVTHHAEFYSAGFKDGHVLLWHDFIKPTAEGVHLVLELELPHQCKMDGGKDLVCDINYTYKHILVVIYSIVNEITCT
jgi:hypothetical protein